jgi:protein-S-isoprenylcysteine O-methyltransferase Ste14
VNNPARKAVLGFTQLIAALGVLLFAPSWTLDYWQAWVYLSVFGASSALISLYLGKHDPQLLERRTNAGPRAENDKRQKLIQLLASFAFVGAMVLPSLDHRFSWSAVPVSVVAAGDILAALGFLIVFFVFKENTFAGAAIAVVPGQTAVATGPYSVVRHPMYSGALVMLLGTPLALGSWWGLVMVIPMTVIIAWRARAEEQFLVENLSGYKEYCQKVRYRLVPLVW